MSRLTTLFCTLLLAASVSARQMAPSATFPPLEKWRVAVRAGDPTELAALYSKSPAPQITAPDKKPVALQDELAFWSSWKSKGLTSLSAEVVQTDDSQPDIHFLFLQLTLTTREGTSVKKQYISMIQGWLHQGGQWLLAISQHSAPARLRQPLTKKEIYPPSVDANKEISETLATASASHKRVLVVFGGNWCFDCHVLDEAFHSPEIAPTLNKSYLVVHVDIGQMDKNLDVAKKYDVPLDRGVPAIAVLDFDGKLLFSQKRGEFEAARSMAPEDILDFLNRWKPPSPR
jgi:ketosteroid isomerase-like protein